VKYKIVSSREEGDQENSVSIAEEWVSRSTMALYLKNGNSVSQMANPSELVAQDDSPFIFFYTK
jgi:hypothetical protein